MKKALSSIFILMLILNASCNNSPQKPMTAEQLIDKIGKTNDGLDKGKSTYIFTLPNGWTTKDTVINGVKFHFLFPPSDVATGANVNVNILNESMHGSSLDVYMQKTEQSMEKYMEGFKKLEEGNIEGGATKGRWMHYVAFQNSTNIECVVYVFPSEDGVAYIMTAGTRKGNLDKFRPTFDAIAKSFKFIH